MNELKRQSITKIHLSMSSLPQHQKPQLAKAQARRPRRGLLICLGLLLGLSWAAYMFMSWSAEGPTASDQGQIYSAETDYEGKHQAPPVSTDMIQLLDLPHNLLPKTGKHRHSGRLIIVGDVHGMKDELIHLLEKVKFDEKRDHLILTGDMISKGPDSTGVVDLAIELGATGIRGNHEDRIILAHAHMAEELAILDQPGPSEESQTTQDEPEDETFGRWDKTDRALVKALGEKRIKWLKKCPVILRVGTLGKMGEVVVVHAGLMPGVKLEKQDSYMVMNMRTIGKDGGPSNKRKGSGWMKVWNKYQKSLSKKDRTTVIYGHDSKRGLQIKKYSMGIDTGCLKGGRLTAVVIEGGHSDHKHKTVHVNCKDRRVT